MLAGETTINYIYDEYKVFSLTVSMPEFARLTRFLWLTIKADAAIKALHHTIPSALEEVLFELELSADMLFTNYFIYTPKRSCGLLNAGSPDEFCNN